MSAPAAAAAASLRPPPHSTGPSPPQQQSKPLSTKAAVGSGSTAVRQLNKKYLQSVSMPSFASIYQELEDDDFEPGPGAYSVPSGFGDQHVSSKSTAQSVSMKAKNEAAWSKVIVTKAHMAVFYGRDTPGAGTYTPHIPAHTTERGQIKFAKSQRKSLANVTPAPGPKYDIIPKDRNTQVSIRFGRAQRFEPDADPTKNDGKTVGPGQYEVNKSSFEPAKGRSFGLGQEAWRKVFVPGIEKFHLGKESPGPGRPVSTIATKDSTSVSFPRATRRELNSQEGVPGPGTYPAHELASVTRLHTQQSQFRNPSNVKFGRPPVKSRLDFRKLARFSQSTWGFF